MPLTIQAAPRREMRRARRRALAGGPGCGRPPGRREADAGEPWRRMLGLRLRRHRQNRRKQQNAADC